MTDNSMIAVALLLLAHDELEKTRCDAREHLAFINSMSGASRNFGTLLNIVFPANPKAKMVSECNRFAHEFEKDRPQAARSFIF